MSDMLEIWLKTEQRYLDMIQAEKRENERLREALDRIAKDAEESPMEDLLCAGEIARKALDG